MPQFALKVDGETILRSDDAEAILREMTVQLEAKEPGRAEHDLEKQKNQPFSDVAYIAGQIVDWIYHEIPSVQRTEMHLEGPVDKKRKYKYPIRNVIIRIEGGVLSNLYKKLERELEIRHFMYHDVVFDLYDIIHNGSPCLVLQIAPRQKISLVTKGNHSTPMPFEIREKIIEKLRKTSKYTYLKTIIQRIVNRHCKCEQVRLGVNLIELILVDDSLTANELAVAKLCFEYLSDTREGESLLIMWRMKNKIRARWERCDIASRSFISQVYEWFGDIRKRECNALSRRYAKRDADHQVLGIIEPRMHFR